MRGSLAMLAFLLLTVAALHSEANEEPVQLKPFACCYSYLSRKVPLRSVKDYFKSSDQCARPGIVFVTRRGLKICTNPTDAWVQEYITYLDNRKGANLAQGA